MVVNEVQVRERPTPAAASRIVGSAATCALVALLLVTVRVDAATVSLSGTGAMAPSFEFLGSGGVTPGDDYALALPGQYTLTNTFSSYQGADPLLGTSSVGPYTFMDSYRFTIDAAAEGSTLVASLGLGNTFDIDHLQLRLYRVPTATTSPTVPGIPAGSVLLTAWQGPVGSATSITSLFTAVQQGAYILDVAGIATGTLGGTYVGQLNLQPVPLPAAAWLLLSGFAVLGGFGRRRS